MQEPYSESYEQKSGKDSLKSIPNSFIGVLLNTATPTSVCWDIFPGTFLYFCQKENQLELSLNFKPFQCSDP